MGLRLLAIFCLISMIAAPVIAGTAQSGVQQYAYLTLNTPDNATVWLVDPTHLEAARVLTTISANAGERIGETFLSPTSEWLVVQFLSEERSALRLFDLISGEPVSVIDNILFPPRPLTISSDFNVFAWSPNGQYFAFHTQVGDAGQNLYLYNVPSRTLKNLGTADENQYQLSWSPDGDRLAVISLSCIEAGCARAALDVYSAANTELEQSIDLTVYARNHYTEGVNFCEIRWSTDAAHISFVDFCDGSALGARREVQVIDIASASIVQATALTPTDIAPANSLFTAALDTQWVDDSNLLIGVESVTGELFVSSGAVSAYTSRYDRETHSVLTIDPRRLGKWTHASDQRLAYVVYTYSASADTDHIPALTDMYVEIAGFDGETLTPQAVGPSGCFLSWNRDANILAYIAREVSAVWLCEPTFDVLYFMFGSGLHTFVPDQQAVALGWFTQPENEDEEASSTEG